MTTSAPFKICPRKGCKAVALTETAAGVQDNFDGLCRVHWNEHLERITAERLAGKGMTTVLRELVEEVYMLQRAVGRCRRY